MDAVTLVAAAVAIAVDHSRNAALEDCLLDRERQAMRAAHLESLIAQRMFTSSTQLPHSAPPVTWRTAHTIAHNEAVQMRVVRRQAAIAARRRYDEQGSPWRQVDVALSRAAWYSESDGSEPESSDQEAPPPAPQPVQRCARCGSTRNLELLLPTGRWANAPMEQRLFCDACIEAAA